MEAQAPETGDREPGPRVAPVAGPAPRSDEQRSRGSLYARPEVWRRLTRNRAVVFLIGSYDGSGNFGDIAQLQAALDLLDGLGDGLAVLPVVDLRYLPSHREQALESTANFDPKSVLVFAPPNRYTDQTTVDEGLVPAAIPRSCVYTATYLYGGGYLNARWADRMLAMLDATDELAARADVSRHDRLATGLQIEPEWARGLEADKRRWFRGLTQLGARDQISEDAARFLVDGSGVEVASTGDDAVSPIIASIGHRRRGRRTGADPIRLNVHLCTGAWVTDHPDRLTGFLSGFADQLALETRSPVTVQPVIAYEDARITERPEIEQLIEETRLFGHVGEVADVILMRPASLHEGLASLAQADLTLSCSYHLALTSLLVGVPAALLTDNHYYLQKADGLRRDFSLPDEFSLDPGTDPRAAARAVLARLGPSRAELDAQLIDARAMVGRRREVVMKRVLDRLGAGLAEARRGDSSGAALMVPCSQYEELLDACALAHQRSTGFSALAAERERWLSRVSSSASWRVTAPLRGLAGFKRALLGARGRRGDP